MGAVAIVDTTIFCNVLRVPQKCGEQEQVLADLERFVEDGITMLLPMATIYETGNHVAQVKQGGEARRRLASRFVEQVRLAIDGKSPWVPVEVPTKEQLSEWLRDFPDSAMRGAGIGDLSIVKEWERAVERTPHLRVFVWSLDHHLSAYDHRPR